MTAPDPRLDEIQATPAEAVGMSKTGTSPEFERKLQEIGAKFAHMVIPRSENQPPLSEVRYPAWTDEPEPPSPIIPAEAVEAVANRLYSGWESSPADWQDYFRRKATEALEAAAPHMQAYLLAELRKAHEALERVEGLCGEEETRRTSKAYVPVDSIRAAVAAAKGDERD